MWDQPAGFTGVICLFTGCHMSSLMSNFKQSLGQSLESNGAIWYESKAGFKLLQSIFYTSKRLDEFTSFTNFIRLTSFTGYNTSKQRKEWKKQTERKTKHAIAHPPASASLLWEFRPFLGKSKLQFFDGVPVMATGIVKPMIVVSLRFVWTVGQKFENVENRENEKNGISLSN